MYEKDTILYVLTKSQEYLKSLQIPNPRLDAEVLLSEILGLERIKLYSNFERKLNNEEKDSYREKIKERGKYKPLAYIVNKKHFYDSVFYVDENVLIPRPETEELVEWVFKELEDKPEAKVLDLCSGSGCIGISINKKFPRTQISFSDISEKAIGITKKNAETILENSNISYHCGDLFSPFQNEKFDVIVSNPPYIPFKEKPELMKDVAEYEPALALFIESPEEFALRILNESKKFLNPEGFLFLEIHPETADSLIEKSKSMGFISAELRKDLSGKNRMLRFGL